MGRQPLRRRALLGVLTLLTTTGLVGVPAPAMAATGVLTGRVVTDTGTPAADVSVVARSTPGPFYYARTAADGTYRMDNVEPAEYQLMFEPFPGMRQYAHQKRYGHLADGFTVGSGQTVVVDETLLPRGNLNGRFVDADGTPIAGAQVVVTARDGESSASARTSPMGVWAIEGVFAGQYNVNFRHGETISQSAYAKVGVAQPDAITVAADATTTVNDTAIARTSVRVTATDAQTGAPLTSFGAAIGGRYGYTETGELILEGVQAGTYASWIVADGYFQSEAQVTLTVGQQGRLDLALTPQSAITVRLVDAATGDPVPNFCVGAFTLTDAVFGDGTCGDLSDQDGDLRVGWLRAGTYRLFATPGWNAAPGHGAQWVGPNGGTGRQLLAQSFTVGTGQTLAGPTIRLDRAGTIAGRVSTPDGQAPTFGHVGVLAGHPLSGSSLGVPVADDGTYTLDFLGPYDWPLLFEAQGQGPQWSGHVGDRHLARTVKVNSGATTAFGFQFRAAVNVLVQVQGLPDGVEFVMAHNAVTGDIMGIGPRGPGGEVTFPAVGPQLVRLRVWPSVGEPRWAGGADFAHATVYWIPASGSKTITVNF